MAEQALRITFDFLRHYGYFAMLPLMIVEGAVATVEAAALASLGIFSGHAHGLTFASQITKVETLRSELTFGQILRGLQVYGYQVVDGKALVQAQVTPGS